MAYPRDRVPPMSLERFARFESYLAKHGFRVILNSQGHCYKICRKGKPGHYVFRYWQINQPYQNVLALLTMSFHYMFPHTPRNSYRCPDCGCNTDYQVERGAIEGSTRCEECYCYQEDQ